MRTELARFENQFAYVEAWLTNKRPSAADDQHHILLENAKVWVWDGYSAINLPRPQDAAADHFWITGKTGMPLMEKVTCVGRIHQYARANGSVDYGIRSQVQYDLDHFLAESTDKAKHARSYKDQLQICKGAISDIEEALAAIDTHPNGAVAFSRWKDLAFCRGALENALNCFQRDVAAAEWRLATSTANGACNRLKEVSRLQGRGLRPAAGFGGEG